MRVLIIDDDKLVCSSLKTIIEAKGVEVVAVGYNGEEAITLYEQHRPDVLMMDIRMEVMNGVDASEKILQKHTDAKILFLTTFNDDEYIIRALKMGVKGYILKQNFDSILPALEAVHMGQNVFNTEIIAKIPDMLHTKGNASLEIDLNDREKQFISLVANGLNNKEIAQTLFLSEGTVRNFLSTLLDKLELRDRTQLAIFYYQQIEGR
ncbi:response regulator transcription factor [Amedibacillus sp. YH-ame10]